DDKSDGRGRAARGRELPGVAIRAGLCGHAIRRRPAKKAGRIAIKLILALGNGAIRQFLRIAAARVDIDVAFASRPDNLDRVAVEIRKWIGQGRSGERKQRNEYTDKKAHRPSSLK